MWYQRTSLGHGTLGLASPDIAVLTAPELLNRLPMVWNAADARQSLRSDGKSAASGGQTLQPGWAAQAGVKLDPCQTYEGISDFPWLTPNEIIGSTRE